MSHPIDRDRRRLLLLAGAGAAAATGLPAASQLLAPVGTVTVREGDDFVDVGAVEEILPGHPLRVTIRADRQDAWTTFRDVELGSAWILKGEDGTVTVFSSACPHLGCAVGFDESRGCFECPCHDGLFGKGGEKLSGPSPRGLDRLQSQVVDGRLLVRFRKVSA